MPVRVIRGHECANSYCGKVYTYDGLYKVGLYIIFVVLFVYLCGSCLCVLAYQLNTPYKLLIKINTNVYLKSKKLPTKLFPDC